MQSTQIFTTSLSSFFSASVAEKDESVSRAYLSELQGITLHLKETEQRLMRAIETPPPSRLLGDTADITVQISDQEVSLSTTWWLQQALQPCFVRSMLALGFCPLSPLRKWSWLNICILCASPVLDTTSLLLTTAPVKNTKGSFKSAA